MRKLKLIFIIIILQAWPGIMYAQEKIPGDGSFMRSNGRIYVVVAVMLTILIGLILYLVRLDKKISKLEKES